MRAIKITYLAGPYDGAREYLDADALGLQDQQAFELAHVTSQFLHIYRCEFFAKGEPGQELEADVRHSAVKVRPKMAAAE